MKVELIKDSIANSIRICTFILEYPRMVHAEMMTHRVFSRNSASSRAIPTKAIIRQLREDPADIVWWGKQMGGMQAKEDLKGIRLFLAKAIWRGAMEMAILVATLFSLVGLHKQLANRILETFQNIRVVVTSTEWNNFLALRDHPDAQPEIAALAAIIRNRLESSTPQRLEPGEWHIPYVITATDMKGQLAYFVEFESHLQMLTLQQALKISASLAAQESYRKSDPSLEKAEAIWERLVGSAPVHASPTEHQAMAMKISNDSEISLDEYTGPEWESGVTHQDRKGNYWSGNFRGWVQHRQLIPNHHVPG